jgi:tetratricopeptide (TPR) repeat protein
MTITLRRLLSTLALAVAVAAAPTPSVAGDATALDEARAALDAAVNAGKVDAVLQARAAFAAIAEAEPTNPVPRYWTVVADWRAVGFAQKDGKDAVKRICEPAIENAEKLVELDPKSAEALALLAGLEGLSMSYRGPAAGMTLGPKMESQMGRALGMAPENPRVRFLDALNTLHKPGFVGGGAKKAAPKFAEAIALFEKEHAAAAAGANWGRDDAELWAGRCAMKLDDPATAKQHYERALAANPDNGWVRHVLLPQAEKALAEPVAKKGRS